MRLASKILNSKHESQEFKVIFGSPGNNEQTSKNEITLDRDAVGRLRRELIWSVGESRMHGVLARVGLSCGQTDAIKEEDQSQFLKEMGYLREVGSNTTGREFVFEVKESFEAKEHLRFFQGPVKLPQCWLMAGYLTGGLSQRVGQPVFFLEMQCVARGDSCCRFIGKPRAAWDAEFDLSLSAYEEDNMTLELSETREQLKLTKDRYQNLFEQSSLAIFIIDPDTGAYLDSNVAASELTGYSQEELSKLNIFDLRPAEEHHQAANYIKALLAEEEIKQHEMTLLRKDGNKRIIAQSSKVLTYGGKHVVQVIMRDITDLKESEQKEKDLNLQLVRSERLSGIGRLAAGVAHELKNPLGAIRNAIYYIRTSLANSSLYENDPQLKEIVKLAESEVDSSVHIIGELLDFSRVVQLVPRKTQINDILEQIPTLIQVPDTIELKMDLDLTIPSASADPDRLKQVFVNIANNAVQSMSEGGMLTIRSRYQMEVSGEDEEKKELLNIEFEDTGKGIEPVHLKKIFEPLFTTKARGTGLGLAISNNIVEKHGGVIQVTSHPKKGTCFTVKLPLQTPQDREENYVS